MPIEFNTTISGSKLQELEISNSIPGLSAFWHFVRGLLSRQKNSALVFKPELPKDIGGFLCRYSNCNFVSIAKKNLKDGNLHFEKLKDAAIFAHELCHWVHFNYLDYKYSSGNPQAGKKVGDYKSKEHHFYVELEAWNLSRKFGKLYKFSAEFLAEIDKCNAKNMHCVLEQDNNAESAFVDELWNPETGEIATKEELANYTSDEKEKFTKRKLRIKKDYSELTYEDYFLDENGKFHLPKLEKPTYEE